MSEAILNKFIYNGEIYNTSCFNETYRNLTPSVYEVVRLYNGVPIFLEEHYERLTRSAASIGKSIVFSMEQLLEYMNQLAKANNIKNNNIKLVLNGFDKDNSGNLYIYLIHSSYPDDNMYINGVKTDLFDAMRDNPHAKIINQKLRDNANDYINKNGLYEVLLVNNNGCITEGSRSNVFFIKKGCLYTSPSDGVLLGVTRQRIIRLCRENGIKVFEEDINSKQLDKFEAAFISGTSPKVLPISSIGKVSLDCSNICLKKVMELYNNEISAYISKHKIS